MKARYLLASLLVVMCAWAGPAWAQSQAVNGTIEGTIKDASGRPAAWRDGDASTTPTRAPSASS